MDVVTRRQKQQALMATMLERKIRNHARQLYEERGQVEGHALQDWVQAESQVLETTMLAPLYRKTRGNNSEAPSEYQHNASTQDVSALEPVS